MKLLPLLILGTVISALGYAADARSPGVGSGFRHSPPPQPPIADGFLGFPGVYVVERVQVIEREVVKEAPPPPPPAEPAPPPRKPYVIGASYDTLPGGCMKMIENGDSYYLCSGEWYQLVSGGKDGPYLAVKAP